MSGERAGDTRVRVKICGLTNLADARLAAECGADALGFVFFAGSKRYLNLETEGDWLARLPAGICKVAVLVDPTWNEAVQAAGRPFIDMLQLHGNESPAFCRRLAEAGIRFTKALPVQNGKLPESAADFSTDRVLLDSKSARGFGGTGETFPWQAGRQFVEEHPELKVFLAGGLTPENVAAAVAEVRPFGVDVTTGVEVSPGRKDAARLRAFFENIPAL
jgi:phosphoribosylanthranilate isomerase